MLTALLEDFQRLPGVTVETMLGRNIHNAGLRTLGRAAVHITNDGEEKDTFCRLAGAADWTLVVAPEFDDVLTTRLGWLKEANGRSLNSTAEATALAGDKLRLAEFLRDRGVPTPPTVCWPTPPISFPAVCKPRCGAGSQATFLVGNRAELQRTRDLARAEDWTGDQIVQRFF